MEHSNPRNWACPICKYPCHQIVYEPYFEEILKKTSATGKDTCFLLEDGTVTFETVEPSRKKNDSRILATPSVIEEEIDELPIKEAPLSSALEENAMLEKSIVTLDLYEPTPHSFEEAIQFISDLAAEPESDVFFEDLVKKLAEPFGIDPSSLNSALFDK